ncbi:uncharacterized protein [Linepithema humile]|uniref:uncharacterized protein n=1 Tax=Linepithema humile TaxID=83485 RepID=UPI00351EE15A
MGTEVKIMNNSINISSTEAYAATSKRSLIIEEQDAIVTLVIVVIGIIIAIVVLFSMGIFIDCKHQKDSMRKRRLRLKMPPLSRRKQKDDVKALASNMYPNDTGC